MRERVRPSLSPLLSQGSAADSLSLRARSRLVDAGGRGRGQEGRGQVSDEAVSESRCNDDLLSCSVREGESDLECTTSERVCKLGSDRGLMRLHCGRPRGEEGASFCRSSPPLGSLARFFLLPLTLDTTTSSSHHLKSRLSPCPDSTLTPCVPPLPRCPPARRAKGCRTRSSSGLTTSFVLARRSAATSSPSRSSSSSRSSSGPSPRTSSTPVSPRRLARLARLIPPPPSWRRPSSSRRGVLGFVRRSADSLPAPSQQTTTTTTTRATRSGTSPPPLVSSFLLAGLLAVGQVHLVQKHG